MGNNHISNYRLFGHQPAEKVRCRLSQHIVVEIRLVHQPGVHAGPRGFNAPVKPVIEWTGRGIKRMQLAQRPGKNPDTRFDGQ